MDLVGSHVQIANGLENEMHEKVFGWRLSWRGRRVTG